MKVFSNRTDTSRKVSFLSFDRRLLLPLLCKGQGTKLCLRVAHSATSSCMQLPFSLQVQNGMNSLYNTPVLWSVYILNLVLKWIEKEGGVEGMIGHSLNSTRQIRGGEWQISGLLKSNAKPPGLSYQCYNQQQLLHYMQGEMGPGADII